ITFGDYFRALITADRDIAPEDETGFRVALIEAFRARGVFPQGLNILSVESLQWERPDFTDAQADCLAFIAEKMRDDVAGLVRSRDRNDLFEKSRDAAAKLHTILTEKQGRLKAREWEEFLYHLGLTSRPIAKLFGEEVTLAQLR